VKPLHDNVELVAHITVNTVPNVSLPDVRAILEAAWPTVCEMLREEFGEGRDAALANAAMLAHDMGHPEMRRAINQLIPEESGRRPVDTPPGLPRQFGAVCGDAIEAKLGAPSTPEGTPKP
jgi:hypothetical protein